jgi:hypothetical protein
MAAPPSYDVVCRLLREHRAEMRVLYDFIADQFLEEEAEDRVIDETGNTGFCLGADLDPDGGEAPETRAWKAKAEAAGQVRAEERFILAVQGLASQKRMDAQHKLVEEALSRTRLDLERSRMRGEDHRARPY